MVNITINGNAIAVEEGTTIIDAAASIGMKIPTLCYLKDIHEIGACPSVRRNWGIISDRTAH